MDHLKGKTKVDLTDIDSEQLDKTLSKIGVMIKKSLNGVAGQLIDELLEREDTYVYFPIEYADKPGHTGRRQGDGIGGPAVKDPLTAYLRIATEDSSNSSVFVFNIRSCIENTLNETAAGDTSFSYGLGLFSQALRKLADEVDEAIEKGNSNEP